MNAMKFLLSLLALSGSLTLFTACDHEEAKLPETESLIDFKDGMYTEYYPGRKAIKFKGKKDENNQRDGVWYFYAENGVEQSMTEYKHGVKNGPSFTRFPNGKMRYYGEYRNDKQVGVWVIYDQNGNPESEKDYGNAEE